MGIRFLCPNGHKLNVKAFLAGQRGICPHCGERFVIPSESIKNIRVESLGGPPSAAEGGALVEEDVELFDFAAQSHLVPTMPSVEIPLATSLNPNSPNPQTTNPSASKASAPNSNTAPTARPVAEAPAASVEAPAEVAPAPDEPAQAPAQRPFDQPDGAGGIALEIGEDFSIVPPTSQANTPTAPIEDELLAAGSRFDDLPDLEELTAAARGAASLGAGPAAMPHAAAPQVAATPPANIVASTSRSPAAQPAQRPVGAVVQPVAPPPAPPAAAMSMVDPISEFPQAVWYVRLISGEQFGPAAGDAMRRWLDEGRVPPGCLVWREGWPDWRRSEATFAVVAQRVPPSIPGAAPAVSAAPTARPPSPASSQSLGSGGTPITFGSSVVPGVPGNSSASSALPEAPTAAPLPPAAVLAAKRRKAQRVTALVIGLLALAVVGLVPVLIYVLVRQ